MKVAAIDCGTNSVRLLIAEPDGRGGLAEITRELQITRLGQEVDATGRLHPDALARTFATMRDYADIIAREQPAQVACLATSAARDASNAEEFLAGVRDIVGVEPTIISGHTEARLSFVGAQLGLPLVVEPVLVMDIGGGSTELVWGSGDQVSESVSLDMGSVRVRERFLTSAVPAPEEIARARVFVEGLLEGAPISLDSAASFVGVAGTATSLSAMHQGLHTYDRAKVHESRLSREDVTALTEHLLTLDTQQTMAEFPILPERRAEVICAGALICERVMARIDAQEMIVSETDILDGIALSLIGGEPLD